MTTTKVRIVNILTLSFVSKVQKSLCTEFAFTIVLSRTISILSNGVRDHYDRIIPTCLQESLLNRLGQVVAVPIGPDNDGHFAARPIEMVQYAQVGFSDCTSDLSGRHEHLANFAISERVGLAKVSYDKTLSALRQGQKGVAHLVAAAPHDCVTVVDQLNVLDDLSQHRSDGTVVGGEGVDDDPVTGKERFGFDSPLRQSEDGLVDLSVFLAAFLRSNVNHLDVR